MKELVKPFIVLILFSLLAVGAYACGSSSGGTSGSSGDTAPPVTSANPVGGNYSSGQSVTFSCTDSGGECSKTFVSDDGITYKNAIDVSLSGATTTYTISLSGGTTILRFFSIDNSNNAESQKTETYVLP